MPKENTKEGYNNNMDKYLLTILQCPISKKGLNILKKDQLAKINSAIEGGVLMNHGGILVAEQLDAALITDDGKRIYPVIDDIPVLLEEESISLEQLT
ncbi:MAG: hypothetical protein CMO97_05440 [Woeseia sp.]|nr:hypothetical protein [Woeseia sp.]